MQISVEDVSPVKKKITVELPPEDIDREMDAAYKQLAAEVRIDGFRKGKAPKAVLESRYKDHLLGEVVSKVIENSYPRAIKEKSLSPVARPDIEVKAGIKQGQPFSYTATVEIRPIINAEGYMGMELKREAITVSDDDIEKGMESLKERGAHFSEVERPAQEKDLVIIDFEGFVDGRPVKNGKASEYPVVIGTNALMPDIEEALKGMSKGGEKEVKAGIPKGYRHQGVAGKEGLFKIKVKSVKQRVLPALDNEFAKGLKLDNIAQLREKVREGIAKQKEAEEKERLKKEILDRLIETNSFDVPPMLVADYLQSFVSQATENIKSGRMRLEDAAEATPEKLKQRYAKTAETRVRQEMLLDAIARQENITVQEEEFELRIKELAASRRQNVIDLKRQLAEQGSDSMLAAAMLEDKVFDFIMGKAKTG